MFDHTSIEEEILKFWDEEQIYARIKKRNGKPFYFLDGPPYVTGDPHPGTMWNKILKDANIRYLRAMGYDVNDKPGFDTHGLPIELKVEKLLKIKNKNEIEEKGIESFIKECKKFADKYIVQMTERFKRFGVWMDWENPYVTYKDKYIESAWGTIKKAYEKQLISEGAYILPYCYRCETTLANYELEYGMEKDPSIYVKFKVKDKENTYLLIWTTTPWTLVANMAVMAHPDYEYVEIEVNNEHWILAKERFEILKKELGIDDANILKTFKGKDLFNLEYEHPFQDLIKKTYKRRVVLSNKYVTLEEGTGLVHTAPGHGPEDYEVGKEYGIEIFCPVDERGNYTEEAGIFTGKNVKKENDHIIDILKERNLLVKKGIIEHRYPHCWRCKTPLIFIKTKQWFISISTLKSKMYEQLEQIMFIPNLAGSRLKDFIDHAPDWCISRQRYWGIPLPIWKCENNHMVVVGSKEELEHLSGKKVKELHRPYVDEITFKCPVCGKEMKRIPDVLDVWFDSGNAAWASQSNEERKKYSNVADLIIEGHDQTRGWFYSLLGSGLIYYDKSPYKRLMMHGFFLDHNGIKMSKSLGNYITLDEILEKYGVDAFRLFGLSLTTWDDLRFSWEEVKNAKNDLNVLLNLIVFLERNYVYVEPKYYEIEDKWLLSKLNRLLKQYHSNFSEFKHFLSVRALRNFLIYDFSQFYMKIAKKRISSNKNKEAALSVIYNTIFTLLKLFSPIIPFVSEYAYQRFYREHESEISIHMFEMPKADETYIDNRLEKDMEIVKEIVSATLKLRNEANVKLRFPLKQLYIETEDNTFDLNQYKDLISELTNVKSVNFGSLDKVEQLNNVRVSLDTNIYPELYNEGILNEFARRIQQMRKELNLIEKDEINIVIDAPEKFVEIITNLIDVLKSRVNARNIEFKQNEGKMWKIDGINVKIEIIKL